MKIIINLLFFSISWGQFNYNHPELSWKTIETEHFRIHFYDNTEQSAMLGATIAEIIYEPITELYNYEPFDKTDIVFTDVDDISNGAAYFYDNKIIIWTSPLDFELRGSHRWLQNVITHEFTHIVSIQKAQKFGKSIPGGYIQWIDYEKEKRPDVLYGYPNKLVSYPIPGTSVPPWLAEGIAQFMYPGADWDNWDSIRDMILRDRTLNNNLLTWTEMNVFGKSGIGNESVYNSGYALSKYLAVKHGPSALKNIMASLSKPFNSSIDKAIKEAIGIEGREVYDDFISVLNIRYDSLSNSVLNNIKKGTIIEQNGTSNLFPAWNEDGNLIAFLSNKENDYFGSTDLFIYSVKNKTSKKIVDDVFSKPSWNGQKLFYSKKSKIANKVGSKFYDLYEFDLLTDKENRITQDARAFSPVYNSNDSTLFYISTNGGNQNIYMIDLVSRSTQKLTDFSNQEIINSLNYDYETNRIMFDITQNHFRDIHFLSLSDSISGAILNSSFWDERQIDFSKKGMVYSDDRSGIFNIYYIDSQVQGYLTNVVGGAFMPDIHESGKIAYSLYEKGGYKIAVLDSIDLIDDTKVGYSPTYFNKNSSLSAPIKNDSKIKSKKYKDHFPPLMIMPRASIDYGTIKPGFYFYSSDIIDKVSLIGGASSNKSKDLDLFMLFEYRHLFPTLFFDFFYLTRNTENESSYSAYKLDNNLKFRLIEFKSGLRFPIYGTSFELFGSWSRYRASIKENIIGQPQIQSGIAYDYYNGFQLGLNWGFQQFKLRVDQNINPVGLKIGFSLINEWNNFIDGLDLSDSGTLISKYQENNLLRGKISAEHIWEIPKTNRWTFSAGTQLGFLNNTQVDSFFHFFAGGMSGIKGYPFYSIEGTNMIIGDLTLRVPIFREKHIPIFWYILQHSTLGFIAQIGDAWDRDQSSYNLKRSLGLDWRLSGYSFYNYPTSIGLEYHYGLDSFQMDFGDGLLIQYGNNRRFYLSILFGF